MKFMIEGAGALGSWGGFLGHAVWKGAVVLMLVFVAMKLWRRSSAAARHLVWTMTFVCLLALPLLVRCVPAWRAPVWMVSPDLVNRLPDALSFNPSRPAHQGTETLPTVARGAAGTGNVADALAPAARAYQTVSWAEIGVMVWFAGVMMGLARFVIVQLRLNGMTRRMEECEKGEQLQLLGELRMEQGIRRPVKLLISGADESPMTWGFARPVIALPADSIHWDTERLRVVLRHELAHVRRWDCLTQELAGLVCALYWFNPLVWLAAGRMRAEREKACDDFVLNAGARPSDYAGHLVEIARRFAAGHWQGAVAMARPSGLEQRVAAIVDGRRPRGKIAKMTALFVVALTVGTAALIGGYGKTSSAASSSPSGNSELSDRIRSFIAEKTTQADAAMKTSGQEAPPEYQPFFAAAARGDWLAVSNINNGFQKRAPQYDGKGPKDVRLRGTAWEAVKEIWGALYSLNVSGEKYSTKFGDGIIESIPPGSIYFGGTDPGRFLVSAMEKSQINGDPFFTLTQNALADDTYLDYLRDMYGKKIQMLSNPEQSQVFQEYVADVTQRYQHDQNPALKNEPRQLKPGESPHIGTDGRVTLSGQVAVMEINGRLVRLILGKNPGREFYMEESFQLDGLYPYAEPHGLIFKLNHQPLAEISGEAAQRDRDYWTKETGPMIGGWLKPDTTVADCAAFVESVYARHDLGGFNGDPDFLQSGDAQKMFSKLRSAIAGIYVWRMNHAAAADEKERMAVEADFAFRQAWVLCPYSPETVNRYAQFLAGRNRGAEALLVAETSLKMPELNAELEKYPMVGGQNLKEQLESLVEQLKQSGNNK